MLVHISFCMLKDIDNFLIKKKDNSAVRMNTIEKNDININNNFYIIANSFAH